MFIKLIALDGIPINTIVKSEEINDSFYPWDIKIPKVEIK